MGIKRSMVYLKHRLLRVADSTHSIALGLAIGFGVSFTPLLGTHFIQAGIFSYIFRGNVFAAILGTFVGNPWTFPFFWWAGYSFGSFMYGVFGFEGVHGLPDGLTAEILWEIIKSHPMTLFLPWMLGGYILAAITIPLSYPVYYYLIEAAKSARDRAVAIRMEERQVKAIKKAEKAKKAMEKNLK